MRLDTTITMKGNMVRGLKKSKTKMTVFATVNAHRSDKRQAMLVGQKYRYVLVEPR